MRVLLTSINHRTAPLELRERFAASTDAGPHLAALRERFPGCECVIVSTCNRFELYIARPTKSAPKADDLLTFLAERFELPLTRVASSAIHREQDQAVAHLFRVCCGLDSMILGEAQVLGQVRQAYKTAADLGSAGPVLHRVFQQAIATAKHARTHTGIDAGRVSIGSVAADLIQQVFTDLSDKTVLGIGAGDAARLTLRSIRPLAPKRLWLTNRTLSHAEQLADDLALTGEQGGARPFDQLDELLVQADIVVTSTAAPKPILTPQRIKPVLKRRCQRPLFIIDLAVPRDADPRIGSMTNLYLYNLDDLRTVVSHSLGHRVEQATACQQHIAPAVAACMSQITHADLGQLIRKLRTKLHGIGEQEKHRTLKKLTDTHDPAALDLAISEHTQRLINKILHIPLDQLNRHDGHAPLGFYAAALRRLFDLEENAHVHPAALNTADAPPRADAKTHAETESKHEDPTPTTVNRQEGRIAETCA